MRVMVLSSYAPTLLLFREDMMNDMVERGHEVIAAAPESEKEWEYKFQKRKIKYVSISGLDRTGTNPIKDIIGFFSILKAIIKEKPDKIFTYQAKTITYSCMAAKLSGTEEVYAMMGGLGSIFRNGDEKTFVRSILEMQYKIAFNYCNKVFFQNKDDSRMILDANLIKESQIVMINGAGVSLEKFTPKAIPKEPVCLIVGR